MNFLNLEYFLVTAEELNFTKASKRLYISQQSLSNHIMKLENDLQVPLFDRTPPLTLTKEGACLVRRARELLRIREDTFKEIQDIHDFKVGELTIGCTRFWGRIILPHVLPTFYEHYPNIQVRLLEGDVQQVEESLRSGRVDISIGYKPADCRNLHTDVICEEKMFLLVPDTLLERLYPGEVRETKLALRETSDITLLKDCPFLVMAPSTYMGNLTNNLFHSVGISPPIVLQSYNLETLLALCFKGMGCMFCSEMMVAEWINSKNPSLIASMGIYPLQHEEADRCLTINYLQDKYLPHAAAAFIQFTRVCMEEKPLTLADLL